MIDWFSPAPSEISSSRISLDFGLRSADLFFRELVVPRIGQGLVRPAVLVAAGIARASRVPPRPRLECPQTHGDLPRHRVLACKLEYRRNPEDPSDRILGKRAFGRDREGLVWTFQRLRQSLNYVRNTHRQAATRAIRLKRWRPRLCHGDEV